MSAIYGGMCSRRKINATSSLATLRCAVHVAAERAMHDGCTIEEVACVVDECAQAVLRRAREAQMTIADGGAS